MVGSKFSSSSISILLLPTQPSESVTVTLKVPGLITTVFSSILPVDHV